MSKWDVLSRNVGFIFLKTAWTLASWKMTFQYLLSWLFQASYLASSSIYGEHMWHLVAGSKHYHLNWVNGKTAPWSCLIPLLMCLVRSIAATPEVCHWHLPHCHACYSSMWVLAVIENALLKRWWIWPVDLSSRFLQRPNDLGGCILFDWVYFSFLCVT